MKLVMSLPICMKSSILCLAVEPWWWWASGSRSRPPLTAPNTAISVGEGLQIAFHIHFQSDGTVVGDRLLQVLGLCLCGRECRSDRENCRWMALSPIPCFAPSTQSNYYVKMILRWHFIRTRRAWKTTIIQFVLHSSMQQFQFFKRISGFFKTFKLKNLV